MFTTGAEGLCSPQGRMCCAAGAGLRPLGRPCSLTRLEPALGCPPAARAAPQATKVKNKQAAPRQITAEQILRESKEIQLEDEFTVRAGGQPAF